MRTISFVEYAELEYQGNIFSKAIIAADVDNDNSNELVIGNVSGNLFIYKGLGSKPWAVASDLGMIACMEVGDVCNHGINYLVTLSAEGWCHIIAVRPDSLQTSSEPNDAACGETTVRPAFKQRLHGNSKVLVIADIDGDGLNEMIIGYTDRVIRSYRWSGDPTSAGSTDSQNYWSGRFVLIESWVLAGQIGSVTVNKCVDGRVDVMASQPGGTFVTLLCTGASLPAEQNDTLVDGAVDTRYRSSSTSPSVIYHPLGSIRARNPGVTTEVVSNISRQKKGKDSRASNYSAICTLDGTLTLVDDDKILWSLYVDHQLFALTKLDITGDGMEEVVACSWDGQTYIVNLSKEVVRFHFRENVAAFCVGLFTIEKGVTVPCLFYATFNNKIAVYYDIKMSTIGTSNLIAAIEQKRDERLTKATTSFSSDALQKLYYWCLYGVKSTPFTSKLPV